MKWITCQLGAREHYAVPRALASVSKLEQLCTDYWANGMMRQILPMFGRFGHSLAGRWHPELDKKQVSHWNSTSVGRRLAFQWSSDNLYDRYIKKGKWFSKQVSKWLLEQNFDNPLIVYSYDTSAKELFSAARKRGDVCVLGQMDPGPVEARIVIEEREIWKGWEPQSFPITRDYEQRRRDEWSLADKIVVNSTWSKSALEQEGVPRNKIVTIPLIYEAVSPQKPHILEESSVDKPLNVLWLGQVNLRKGIQYLISAARLLLSENVRFNIVGDIQIDQSIIAKAPKNMHFLGAVPRNKAVNYYQQADVFVLPTLSDGFAITQLEAMSYGVPVITTDHCGDVVKNSINGYKIPIRDAEAIVDSIGALIDNRELLRTLSENALLRVTDYSIRAIAPQWDNVISDVI